MQTNLLPLVGVTELRENSNAVGLFQRGAIGVYHWHLRQMPRRSLLLSVTLSEGHWLSRSRWEREVQCLVPSVIGEPGSGPIQEIRCCP